MFGFHHPIWFYRCPVDFRKQIDGLVTLVAEVLKQDPLTGQLFVFRNHRANKLKMLYWDTNGFWLLYKRLEKGRFTLPAVCDAGLSMSKEQLGALLSGIDFEKQQFLAAVTAEKFY